VLRLRRPRSRQSRILLVLALLVALIGVVTASTTSLETYSGSGVRPGWAEPCRDDEPRHDRELLADCARGTGFVAWVREEGTGESHKVHFALVGRFGTILVKLGDPDAIATPRIASHVIVVGALVRASNGMREIQAWRLER
jgi:hypothetical protein